MRLHLALTGVLALLVSACSQTAPGPTSGPDLAAEERAIRDADASWLQAAQAHDAAGNSALFASDGVAYREHVDPLVGPAAFQSYLEKRYADNPKLIPTWTTNSITVAGSGDIAIQTGEYHETGLGPQGDGEERGRFVTVWKKVNGEWKVAHDIGTTTMPESQGQ